MFIIGIGGFPLFLLNSRGASFMAGFSGMLELGYLESGIFDGPGEPGVCIK